MIVRKLRLQQGWSQEQLSEFSGLSIRTIQRIERGHKASVESLKSLAAVFEVDILELTPTKEIHMNDNTTTAFRESQPSINREEEEAIQYVKDIKDFYSHLISYVCVIAGLFVLNLFSSPDYIWAIWPAMGWGIGVVSHAFWVFEVVNFFSPDWEKRQIEKRLGRKL